MRRIPILSSLAAAGLVLAAASPMAGQTAAFPPISARQFTGGSVKMVVRGPVPIDQEVAINTQASLSDGGMTWLQFGASGAETPNALITYAADSGELGVSVAKGKYGITAGITPGETPQCSGKTDVTGNSISGDYACKGVTSYDAATGKMGKADVEVRFTAKS